MSKRKAIDDDLEFETGGPVVQKAKANPDVGSRFKEKHSLDSDEEDEDKDKYDVMAEDDIEGQEDDTIDYDDGIKITPFNMKDELEEGHFDKEGTFIFDKEQNIADNWLENIDWVKIKERPKGAKNDDDDDSDEEEEDKVDKIDIYQQILKYLKPGESVARAIKRLGGSKSSSQRWKKPKPGQVEKPDGTDKEAMLELTGFADKLTQIGDYDIYSDTFEKLTHLVNTANEAKPKKVEIPADADSDDALDMFADDIDEKKADAANGKTVDAEKKSETEAATASNPLDDEVMWEYKWNSEGEEVFGPYSSSQMQEWVDDGFFKDDVLVRKAGNDGDFYSSRRIEFDLYT
ncbi:CD2 antigen cytoplasmic tail-binding protein 2 homolog [Lineus longissimus]|uniref:CD2 antigen cytoplasmic tail-binding protein 2 homolog n=1 Tax=Lineus longissimus TaxID=88925 RepID=UPI002B4CA531